MKTLIKLVLQDDGEVGLYIAPRVEANTTQDQRDDMFSLLKTAIEFIIEIDDPGVSERIGELTGPFEEFLIQQGE